MRERLPLVTDEFASGVKNRQLGGGAGGQLASK